MLLTDFRNIIYLQIKANFGIVAVLFLLASCANVKSPEVSWSSLKSLQPISSFQYEKDIFEIAFVADNQILIVPRITKGQTSVEPEMRNYAFQKLDNIEIPAELQTVTAFLGRPDDRLSYFIYHSGDSSILAHYVPGRRKTFSIGKFDLGDQEAFFRHGYTYFSVPDRGLLFFAPSYSNTIFEKTGENPVRTAIIQQDLVVRDLAYNSKTNELIAISSIDNLLIRFSATKSGLEKKDQLQLNVRRGQSVSIDEVNGNIWILDNFANTFEVIRTSPSLESVGVYSMPKNVSGSWEGFEQRSKGNLLRSSTAYHFKSLGAMVAIAGGDLKIQDTKELGHVPFRLEGTFNVRRLAVSKDQRYLLLLSNRGGLLLYDLAELY